jgi:hypothetical protein
MSPHTGHTCGCGLWRGRSTALGERTSAPLGWPQGPPEENHGMIEGVVPVAAVVAAG